MEGFGEPGKLSEAGGLDEPGKLGELGECLVRLVSLVSLVGLVESIENGRRSVHSNFVGSLCSDPLLARSDRKL